MSTTVSFFLWANSAKVYLVWCIFIVATTMFGGALLAVGAIIENNNKNTERIIEEMRILDSQYDIDDEGENAEDTE